MLCASCQRELADTAVKCKYCKQHVNGYVAEPRFGRPVDALRAARNGLVRVLLGGKGLATCPWTLLDVVLLTALIVVFMTSDPFGIGMNILRFLRLHFGIFTREPRLLYYLTININTVLLKCVSLIFLIILVRSRHVSFWNTVISPVRVPGIWRAWMPIYVGVCLLARSINSMNPLVPDLAFDSVFGDAFILGNLAVIFSVLVVAPFVEEVIFRGFMYPALNRYMGIAPAVVITSIFFTFAHYPQVMENPVFMAVLFTLSAIITYVRARTGSTWVAIVMHHIYNLVSVGVGYLYWGIDHFAGK